MDDAVIALFNKVLVIANQNDWLSGEHFCVDGTLIQAWAGHKRFVRKDGSDDDGDNASRLRYMGHTLCDNRHGLIANAKTDGYAISQQKRKLIEQGFGWAKFIGPIRQ